MIVSVEEVMKLPEYIGQDKDMVKSKLDALELMIRKYTNNNFQNRNIRFLAEANSSKLYGVSPFLKIGDTVQISESGVNDGLYVIIDIADNVTVVDEELFSVPYNLVTKVQYPKDIKQGILNLMKWEATNRDKVGIKQETISRHSVTYFDLDSNNQVMGFPVSLLGFLEPYKKARF